MNAATADNQNDDPQATKADRWLRWPAIAAWVGVFCLLLLCGLPGSLSFVLIPFVVLGGLIAFVAVLFFAGMAMARRKPRKAASIAVAIIPLLLWRPIQQATDYAHLALTVGFGAGQIGDTPPPADGKFSVYDWSVGLAGGPTTLLIHDPTDQIAIPLKQQRSPNATDGGVGNECAGTVRHLLGHYYICTF